MGEPQHWQHFAQVEHEGRPCIYSLEAKLQGTKHNFELALSNFTDIAFQCSFTLTEISNSLETWSPEGAELLQAVQRLAQKDGLVLKNSNGRWCLQGLHDVPDEQSWQEAIRLPPKGAPTAADQRRSIDAELALGLLARHQAAEELQRSQCNDIQQLMDKVKQLEEDTAIMEQDLMNAENKIPGFKRTGSGRSRRARRAASGSKLANQAGSQPGPSMSHDVLESLPMSQGGTQGTTQPETPATSPSSPAANIGLPKRVDKRRGGHSGRGVQRRPIK